MDVTLIAVPYDSARRDYRMGAGPRQLLASGLREEITRAGHALRIEWIEAEPDPPPAEIRTAFELAAKVSARVRQAVGRGSFPVVLSGNCSSSLGALAGLGAAAPAVFWFDAHGDLNTPETTTSGFLDGMALAIATGRCFGRLAATIPGFRMLFDTRLVLLATRDLDPPEERLLTGVGMTALSPEQMPSRFPEVVAALRSEVQEAYIHFDLDALDPAEGRANAFTPPGGLFLHEAAAALARIGQNFRIRGLTLSAYDPACDPEKKICHAASRLLLAVLGSRLD